VQPDRVAGLDALAIAIAGQELLHREVGRQGDRVGQRELRQPLAVVPDEGLLAVEDLVALLGVGARRGRRLFLALAGTARVLVTGVAHLRGERADEERDLVPEVLELAQLAHRDGVTQVQVGRAGIVARVDAQRPALLAGVGDALPQLLPHVVPQEIVAELGAEHDGLDLLVDGGLREVLGPLLGSGSPAPRCLLAGLRHDLPRRCEPAMPETRKSSGALRPCQFRGTLQPSRCRSALSQLGGSWTVIVPSVKSTLSTLPDMLPKLGKCL
jgi:hypothetical protein